MSSIVSFIRPPAKDVSNLYITAWAMITDSARTTLYAIGVNRPIDLYEVLPKYSSGEYIYRGRAMDTEAMEAYLEFCYELRREILRRKFPPKEVVRSNVLQLFR